MSAEIRPWNRSLWQRLTSAATNWHHAQLLQGQTGVGKLSFALALAKLKLCLTEVSIDKNEDQTAIGCGQCRSCDLFDMATHPDLHILTSEKQLQIESLAGRYAIRYTTSPETIKRKPRSVISVDQIRELVDGLISFPQLSRSKIAIISPAHQMNINASNALLKALEEPGTNTYFILETSMPWRLPATIRSRCVSYQFRTPNKHKLKDWLGKNAENVSDNGDVSGSGFDETRTHSGLPHAIGNAQLEQETISLVENQVDPLAFAQRWSENTANVIYALQLLCVKATKAAITGDPHDTSAVALAQNMTVGSLYEIYDKLGRYQTMLDTGIDEKLLLEDIFITFRQAKRS